MAANVNIKASIKSITYSVLKPSLAWKIAIAGTARADALKEIR